MPRLVVALFALVLTLPATAADGLTTQPSRYDVPETERRLLAALEAGGMHVVASVDHAKAAQEAGLTLPPTRVVIFGNPKVGTQLMQCTPSVAIDLPMKMLIWEEEGTIHVGYNTSDYLAERHRISGCDAVLAKVEKALANFARQAAGN